LARASPDIPSKFLQCQEISRRLGALGTQICPDNGGSAVQKRPLPKVTRSVRGVKLPSSMAVALGGPGKTGIKSILCVESYIYMCVICILFLLYRCKLYMYIYIHTNYIYIILYIPIYLQLLDRDLRISLSTPKTYVGLGWIFLRLNVFLFDQCRREIPQP